MWASRGQDGGAVVARQRALAASMGLVQCSQWREFFEAFQNVSAWVAEYFVGIVHGSAMGEY